MERIKVMDVLYPEIGDLNPNLKYLVIDSKYGLHPWRFSIETFFKLHDNDFNVDYLSLVTLDPNLIFGKIRIFLRRIKFNNERNRFVKRLINKDRLIVLNFFNPKIYQWSNYFKLILKNDLNLRLKIGIDSWLAVKYGKTNYKKTFLTKFISIWVARSYFKTILFLEYISLKDNYDVVITFNGRFPIDAAISEYCANHTIKIIFFDGGSIANNDYNKIQYFETSPHDSNELSKKVDYYWNLGNEEKFTEARISIESMINGERFVKNSFNWEAQPDKIEQLDNFDFGNLKKSLIFFASSDWEQGAISYWKPSYGFTNQFDMLVSLAKICYELNIEIVIKPHPIRKNVNKKSNLNEYNMWYNFCLDKKINAKVIPNFNQIKTKFLLNEGAIIAGFGTSVLAQSIYLGKPTIMGYAAAWVNESNIHCLTDNEAKIRFFLDELIERDLNPEQKVALKESVLPWAYYRSICGTKMTKTDFSNGKLFVSEIQIDQPK